MNWLRITHHTTYRYHRTVRFGPHRLVLRPREGHDVRVEEMRLEVSPEFELEWSRDIFGNSIATVHLLSPSDELSIRSEVLLTQNLPFPIRSPRARVPIPYPVQFYPLEQPVISSYLASTYPDDIPRVKEWLDQAPELATSTSAEEVMLGIGRRIQKSINYRRREEKGVQTPGVTLSTASGSCRDLATLMLEALRIFGFPARFASGYLDCRASEAGRASTHAWAEAYLPEIGWTGYDPTLGESASSKHVVTGVSQHPRGVMPVTGTFFDREDAFHEMRVTVQTERFAERPPHSGFVSESSDAMN